jgi:hypothetical protein
MKPCYIYGRNAQKYKQILNGSGLRLPMAPCGKRVRTSSMTSCDNCRARLSPVCCPPDQSGERPQCRTANARSLVANVHNVPSSTNLLRAVPRYLRRYSLPQPNVTSPSHPSRIDPKPARMATGRQAQPNGMSYTHKHTSSRDGVRRALSSDSLFLMTMPQIGGNTSDWVTHQKTICVLGKARNPCL